MPDVEDARPGRGQRGDEGVVLPVVQVVAEPWSPLEDEIERDEGVKSHVDWNRSRDSVVGPLTVAGSFADAGRSAESLLREHERPAEETSTKVNNEEHTPSTLQSPGNPLKDLEEACATPVSPSATAVSPTSKPLTTIPRIQEPAFSGNDNIDDDESSDSWTGDDEFLPRSTRRQKRMDRKQHEPAPKPQTAAPRETKVASTQLLRPQAPACTSPNYPLPSPSSRSTRFRAATPLAIYRE